MSGENREKNILQKKQVTEYFQTPTNTEFRQSIFLKVFVPLYFVCLSNYTKPQQHVLIFTNI